MTEPEPLTVTESESVTPFEFAPTRWSRLAMASLVLAVLPIGSIVAPLLGVAALVRFRSRPELRGRGLAWGGIGLGLVATALMVGSAYGMYRSFTTLASRPSTALTAAWAGDGELFREQMTKPGSETTSADLVAFVNRAKTALGTLRAVEIAPSPPPAPATPRPEREMLAMYTATFDKAGTVASIPLEVTFERPAGIESVAAIKIRRFQFMLADGTRIVFPEDDRPTATESSNPTGKPSL